MTKVPVVTIETENGPVRINKSDFDPATMTLAGAVAPAAPAAPPAGDPGTAPTPATPAAPEAPAAPVAPPAGDPGATQGLNLAPEAAAAPTAPQSALYVTKKGRKFIVTDQGGNAVEMAGIEPGGYAKENEAWAAVMAVSAKS